MNPQPRLEGRRWTEIDVIALEYHWHQGQKLEDIATALGRTPGAVRVKAAALGMGQRGAREGLTMAQVAKALGVGRNTVRAAIRHGRIGSPYHQGKIKRYGETQVERIRELVTPRKRRANWGEMRRRAARLGQPRTRVAPACVRCGTKSRPHYEKDMCKACSKTVRRQARGRP